MLSTTWLAIATMTVATMAPGPESVSVEMNRPDARDARHHQHHEDARTDDPAERLPHRERRARQRGHRLQSEHDAAGDQPAPSSRASNAPVSVIAEAYFARHGGCAAPGERAGSGASRSAPRPRSRPRRTGRSRATGRTAAPGRAPVSGANNPFRTICSKERRRVLRVLRLRGRELHGRHDQDRDPGERRGQQPRPPAPERLPDLNAEHRRPPRGAGTRLPGCLPPERGRSRGPRRGRAPR